MTPSMSRLIQPNDVVVNVFENQKKGMMPAGGRGQVAPEDWAETWEKMISTPLADHSLVYINIPFCINHCVFCGFYKNKWKDSHGMPYVDRLIAELAYEASLRPKNAGSIDAVYFGGGTPTALDAKDLSRLIHAVREYLPLSPDCEITVEGRMTHFTQDKIEASLAAGANRFSIGVQSFNGQIRQKLGRKHSGEEAKKYMAQLASYDQAVVVLDLIYGLPGQTHEIWENDIETALSLRLDGLDVYSFKCFPFLPINRMIEKGALPAVGDVNTQATQYAYAVRRMQSEGWPQISNSHFAAPNDKERNIYNRQVKMGTPFLCFGSGAGGCHAGYSYSVTGDLEKYLLTPIDRKPLGSLSRTAENRHSLETLKGNLELGTIAYGDLPQGGNFEQLINEWRQNKLLDTYEDHAKLTVAGRFWSTSMSRNLLEAIA